MYRTLETIQNKHIQVLERLKLLNDALEGLRYDGKLSLGRNLKNIQGATRFFRKELFPHIRLDERVVFPFIEKHIPKLSPVVRLLRVEHREFWENLDLFEKLFEKLKRMQWDAERHQTIEKLRDKGVYLVCLLRNHILAESEAVYKVSGEELHKKELQELVFSIQEFEKSAV